MNLVKTSFVLLVTFVNVDISTRLQQRLLILTPMQGFQYASVASTKTPLPLQHYDDISLPEIGYNEDIHCQQLHTTETHSSVNEFLGWTNRFVYSDVNTRVPTCLHFVDGNDSTGVCTQP